MSSHFHDLVVEEWRRRGVGLKPPIPEAVVNGLFDHLGCLVSSDVKALYARVGGFCDPKSMDGLWQLWSPEEIRRENRTMKRGYVAFADYLCNSHLYCLRYEDPETSSVYISHEGHSLEAQPIAGSLAEFLEVLLCNPDDVDAHRLDE